MAGDHVLEIRDLRTHFFTRAGVVKAVDGVSLHVDRGEILGVAGESGSGKSVTAFSVLGLVDPPGRIVSGSVRFGGSELVGLGEEGLRRIRGRRVAMVFQDPMMTLNPLLSVEAQMVEAVLAHERTGRKAAVARSLATLDKVGIPDAARRIKGYPHQFSGGMRQRVAIAIALLHEPELIIADEPTTALDVTIQGQILHEMKGLCAELGMALIWISHDLAVLGALAGRINVMYAGRVVESGRVDEVLDRPRHPYTKGLLGSVASNVRRGESLAQIPGMPPNLLELPPGCAFSPRCPRVTNACRGECRGEDRGPDGTGIAWIPVTTEAGGREFRCLRPWMD
jgi:peptide/nickel transport system ATP-binding protein